MNAHTRPTLTWEAATEALIIAQAEKSAKKFAAAKAADFARGVRLLIDHPERVGDTVRCAESLTLDQLIVSVARRPNMDKWPDDWRMVWAAVKDEGFAEAWRVYRERIAQ